MLKTETVLYIVNASLLLLHEIESAYEREWEILNLPGKITGFLLLHIPILLFLFYGAVAIEKQSFFGLIAGIVTGGCGLLPVIVHKLFFKRPDRFNRLLSDLILYANLLCGSALALVSAMHIIR